MYLQVRVTALQHLQPLPRLSLNLVRQGMENGKVPGVGSPVAQWGRRVARVHQDLGNLTLILVMWT